MNARILIVIALLSGCASEQRQEIAVSDSRVTRIIIAGPNEVARNCRGDHDDHGRPRLGREDIGGCYHRPNGPIWISWVHDIGQVLRHEVCHAITDLPDYECDNMYPLPAFTTGYVPPHHL